LIESRGATLNKGKVKTRQKRKRQPNRIARFFRDVRAEIRRVVWPTPRETRNLTLVVLALSGAMGLLLWGFDSFFAWLYTLLT
jgi:preprotein translocase subunit SecE